MFDYHITISYAAKRREGIIHSQNSPRPLIFYIRYEINKNRNKEKLMSDDKVKHQRQWRDYHTESGSRPVKDFLFSLPSPARAAILVEMGRVRECGVKGARHLRGEIYEVRAAYNTNSYRILFAREGHFKQVLLSLVGFHKKTQETPQSEIQLAERRLAEWRRRKRIKHSNQEC